MNGEHMRDLNIIVLLLIVGNLLLGNENYKISDTNGMSKSPMILIYDTNLDNGTNIILPLRGTVSVSIDWGDGNIESVNQSGDKEHVYSIDGEYTVAISGQLSQFGFGDGSYPSPIQNEATKLVKILDFGDLNLVSLSCAFIGCSNLIEVPGNIPSTIVDLSYLFHYNDTFTCDVSNWDVSNVINMNGTFNDCMNFVQDLSNWNVSNVETMKYMFHNATQFNSNISGWNVSKVTDMSSMFGGTFFFNQDIGSWDVSNVTDMSHMFYSAYEFNQNLDSWDVSNVTNMSYMFANAENFNGEIGNWNVSNVTNMTKMFSSLFPNMHVDMSFNKNIGNWNVSNVNDMSMMFYYSTSFNQDISDWNVSNVQNMYGMFSGAPVFDQDISSWDVSNVENMRCMFDHAYSFNGNLNNWNVSNITDMSYMFYHAEAFNQNLTNWNVENVVTMERMFDGAYSFDQDLGAWNIVNVVNLTYMFSEIQLSTENYDSILLGWSQIESLHENLTFYGGNSQYSVVSAEARNFLINEKGWEIIDGGLTGDVIIDTQWGPGQIEIITDIAVQEGVTLTIASGTIIDFQGPYSIEVNGRLIAEGAYDDKIKFQSNAIGGWLGLVFKNDSQEKSILTNCIISDVRSDNENGAAIYLKNIEPSKAVNLSIVDVIIEDNDNDADGGGLFINGGNVEIVNSLIINNHADLNGGAIYFENAEALILNCTIADNDCDVNGGGIAAFNSNIIIYNSILWNNQTSNGINQIYIGEGSTFSICNSNIEGGFDGITGPGSGINFNGVFINNIDQNPLFSNSRDQSSYSISANSPCIDSGSTDIVNFQIPDFDIIGNNRIYPDNIDIGAYEYTPSSIEDNLKITDFYLFQNYPNPFNPTTTITFNVPENFTNKLDMLIYNMNGQLVEKIELRNVTRGVNNVILNLEKYSSGLYYYELHSANFSMVKKMILCK